MRSSLKITVLVLALAVSATAARGDVTASNPLLPGQDHGAPILTGVNTVLLIETGIPVGQSLGRALTELGVPYDFLSTSDFSAVNLAPYQHVFVGMDGGGITTGSIVNVRNWVSGGHCLHFYGGSCWQEYATALNDNLLQNDVNNYCWTTVSGAPDVTVTNAGHYLAAGLPANYTFIDHNASYYQTRTTDAGVSLAARNGDGFKQLMSKPIGSGNFDICINSAFEGYYANNADYQWLKLVVRNMLVCGGATAVEGSTWGTIKAIYQ